MNVGDRVRVMEGGPTTIGLLDLRGYTGTVEGIGRVNARVRLDNLGIVRLIPLAILAVIR